MATIILILLLIFSGKLARFPKAKRYDILKAVIIVFLETIIASLFFTVMNVLTTMSFLRPIILNRIDNMFVVILLFAVINAFILYWINKWAFKKFNVHKDILTLCEYIIQWSLIYSTLYQILFDELIKTVKNNEPLKKVIFLNITSPTEMLFLILPALISIWIAIISYKHSCDLL